jgi:hypothetical protein
MRYKDLSVEEPTVSGINSICYYGKEISLWLGMSCNGGDVL